MNEAFPKRSYAAIIFDCDGTLTDSMPVHFLAWQKTMKQYGISFPKARFYSMGGMPTNRIIELLSREQGIEVDSDRAAIEKEQYFVESMGQLEPIVPVLEVAEFFRGKIPMAVASGGYRDVIHQELEQIGCRSWFDAIVTAEDTSRHKPEPDVFLKAAELLKVNPTNCLVYEDSDLGLRAADAAGMDWIDVRTFHTPKDISAENPNH